MQGGGSRKRVSVLLKRLITLVLLNALCYAKKNQSYFPSLHGRNLYSYITLRPLLVYRPHKFAWLWDIWHWSPMRIKSQENGFVLCGTKVQLPTCSWTATHPRTLSVMWSIFSSSWCRFLWSDSHCHTSVRKRVLNWGRGEWKYFTLNSPAAIEQLCLKPKTLPCFWVLKVERRDEFEFYHSVFPCGLRIPG